MQMNIPTSYKINMDFILNIIFIKAMGTYCSNPLQFLIDEYGQDVGKMIVLEKTKEYFSQKYPAVKTDLSNQTQNFQKQFIDKVDTESKTTVDQILSKINQIKATKQKQVQLFEKTSNKKLDDIIGVSQLNSKVEQLKTKSTDQVKLLGTKILDQADVLADKQQQLLEDQKPKLPIYENLPQCLKDKVFEDGVKQFGNQITQQQQKVEGFFKDTISFNALKDKTGVSIPDDEVKKLGTEFGDKVDTVKKTIEGSNVLGAIKSFF